MTNDTGWAELTIPPPINLNAPYFDYLEIEDRPDGGPPRVNDLLYSTNTFTIYSTDRWTTASPTSSLLARVASAHASWTTTSSGLVTVLIASCSSSTGSVSVSADGGTAFYTNSSGNVVDGATLAPAGGLGWIVGLSPGLHTLTVTNADGRVVVRPTVPVRAGTLTVAFYGPDRTG